MKKFIPTVLAIAVFVALFVWVKVSGMDGEVDEEEETPEEEAVWKVDAQDIEAIRVEREDGMLVFNKEKGGWQATEPQPFPVDGASLDAVASSMASLTGKRIEQSDQALADFGLEDPSTAVTLRLSDGQTYTLSLGDETPVDNMRYVQVEGVSAIYTVDAFALEELSQPADTFMDRTLWSVEEDDVTSIALTWGDEEIQIARDGDEWKVNGKQLSTEQAGAIFSQMNAVTAQGLPVEAMPDGSDFQLTIETEEGAETWTGARKEDRLFVQKEGGEWIYPVVPADIDQLIEDVHSVREQKEGEREGKDHD